MITTIITFLTEKIVAVVITIVVVVAAVPTLIVAIHGDTITITPGTVASFTRHGDDEERARLILEIKTSGDTIVIQINNEEATCDAQISQLASLSKLNAAATKVAIENGKTKLHNATLPFVKEITADEDEFEHLSVITVSTTQTFLIRISTVQLTALGDDSHVGVLITTCQTILIEIRQIVVVTTGHEVDDDIRTMP